MYPEFHNRAEHFLESYSYTIHHYKVIKRSHFPQSSLQFLNTPPHQVHRAHNKSSNVSFASHQASPSFGGRQISSPLAPFLPVVDVRALLDGGFKRGQRWKCCSTKEGSGEQASSGGPQLRGLCGRLQVQDHLGARQGAGDTESLLY